MIPIRPLTWPKEYWTDEQSGQQRPIVRCAEETCHLAKRGLAFTYLDVKFPKVLCGACQTEFEFTLKDCTHPYASLAPPIGDTSSKGKGKAKGYGDKGKGKGKSAFEYISGDYKGKGKGKGSGVSGEFDIMAILKQYGSGIISEQQAAQIKNAMKISPITPKPKTPLQDAKSDSKAAFAAMNIFKNKLDQSKESAFAIDRKVKAMLLTICENTREYVNLKQVVLDSKARLDELLIGNDTSLDQQLAEMAQTHANAINQLQQFSVDDDELADLGNGDDADSYDVYGKSADTAEPPQADAEEVVEEVEMQQVATKRPLPSSPLLPPIDLGADPSTEAIMGQLFPLNVAKKGKTTPRDNGDSAE